MQQIRHRDLGDSSYRWKPSPLAKLSQPARKGKEHHQAGETLASLIQECHGCITPQLRHRGRGHRERSSVGDGTKDIIVL